MSDLLSTFVVALVAAAIAALSTPLFATLARRAGLVARPRGDRWHQGVTPLLGGAGIALGVLPVLAIVMPPTRETAAVLGAATFAFALGLADDFRHLAPTTKLVGQVLVGILLLVGGVRVEIVPLAPVSFVLTIFWVVAMMNALNLLDNMDGLAAGISAIAAAMLALTALPENPAAALIAGATAGAGVGFLVHNFFPARVFMGDAGSLLLGFLLAAGALLHTSSGAANLGLALLGPLAVLALPIFDTALVVISRRLAGRPISRGGRDHASHRLAALGLSDRRAVLVLYAVAFALGALALLIEPLATAALPLLAIAAVTLLLFGAFLGGVDVYRAEGVDDATQAGVLRAMATYGRFGLEIGVDVVLLTVAYYGSYLIRFEGQPDSAWLYLFVQSLPLVVGAQLAALVGLRVYRTLWRFFVLSDALGIVRALMLGSALGALGILILYRFEGYSRAVVVMDGLLATALIIGARAFSLWLRHWFQSLPRAGERRVIIVGADEGGIVAARLLARASGAPHRPIGFLDDDPGKRYRRISGVPIVGTIDDLRSVVERMKPDLVVVTIEDLATTTRVRASCDELGVDCRSFVVAV